MEHPRFLRLRPLVSGSTVAAAVLLAAGWCGLSILGIPGQVLIHNAVAAPPDHAGQGGGYGGGGVRDGTGPHARGGEGYGGPNGGGGNTLQERVFESEGVPRNVDGDQTRHEALVRARTLLDPTFTPSPDAPVSPNTVGAYERSLTTDRAPASPTLENLAQMLAPVTAAPIDADTINQLNLTLGVSDQFGATGIQADALATRVNQLVQDREGGAPAAGVPTQ